MATWSKSKGAFRRDSKWPSWDKTVRLGLCVVAKPVDLAVFMEVQPVPWSYLMELVFYSIEHDELITVLFGWDFVVHSSVKYKKLIKDPKRFYDMSDLVWIGET